MRRPAHLRQVVDRVCQCYRISERYACRLARSTYRYESTTDEQAALRMRMKELAAVRVRYGYRRLYILLRREGWQVNLKRVYRLYCEEKLSLRTKPPVVASVAGSVLICLQRLALTTAGRWILWPRDQ